MHTCRYVISDEHSTCSSRSWRYQAITVSVSVRGTIGKEEVVRKALQGAAGELSGLVFGNDDGLGDKQLTDCFDD